MINISYLSKEVAMKNWAEMEQYFSKCIKIFYGEELSEIDIGKVFVLDMIAPSKNSLSAIQKNKTGVYIFFEGKQPVYVGVGGSKVRGQQDIKSRISQEIRMYSLKPGKYSRDRGATLSYNIQKIEGERLSRVVTPEESIEKYIKTFELIIIYVGDVSDELAVLKSNILEKILISILKPKYNLI